MKSLLKKIPGVTCAKDTWRVLSSLVRNQSWRTLTFSPPGHFYSPLPSLKETRAAGAQLFGQRHDIPGVDLREEGQKALLAELARFYGELPFPETKSEGIRYYFQNSYFGYGDAIVLYSMLRHFEPSRLIEVGSGFSSAVMLDTRERFLKKPLHLTFIEPYPERLMGLLTPKDRQDSELLQRPIQGVDAALFGTLERNDILFVDSSHVAKLGSDVTTLFFEVLPALKPGVVIHVHDILWPFEYPEKWCLEGRAWNEAYLLRSFLQYNSQFEILFFNSYMGSQHSSAVKDALPHFAKNPGGSIWLRKLG